MLDRDQQSRVDYEHRFTRREHRLGNRCARIPKRYWGMTYDDFVVNRDNREMFEKVTAWADTLWDTDGHGGRGFLLLGLPGVGKTMLSAIVGKTFSDDGGMVRFLTLAEYVEMLIRQMKLEKLWSDSDEAKQEWVDNDLWIQDMIHTAHLVILDDIGKEHHTNSGWAEDSFDLLLRKRVALGRPTIMTSNIPLSRWDNQYSEAMQSFVYEAGEVIEIVQATDERRRTR